jgi:acyl-CoA reductase-like NAD-dependent aldehyde dehydrogenase
VSAAYPVGFDRALATPPISSLSIGGVDATRRGHGLHVDDQSGDRASRRKSYYPGRLRVGEQLGAHFLGASFGGYKQSGIGREEGFEELWSFTRSKNINITP